MSKLLAIHSSPRAQRSKSNAVADVFLAAYRQQHPADTIEQISLPDFPLPVLDEATLDGKYAIMHGSSPSPEQMKHWAAVEAVIERFKAADKYLFAVPMWNFGIPYTLKHFIDVIVQPSYTFAYSPETGYTGLLAGRPAAIIYASGGTYEGDTAAMDMQKPYLELVLGFMGITDVRSVVIAPTLMEGPDVAQQKVNAAIEKAKELAKAF
jgi:FMN-dependent NADH-azoreductase